MDEDAEARVIQTTARSAAGVLVHSPRDSPYNNTVLVTAATSGYIELLQNWMCQADALGLRYLVMALDRRLYEGLSTGAVAYGTVHYPKLGPGGHAALHSVARFRHLPEDVIGEQFHNYNHGMPSSWYAVVVQRGGNVVGREYSANMPQIFSSALKTKCAVHRGWRRWQFVFGGCALRFCRPPGLWACTVAAHRAVACALSPRCCVARARFSRL